MPARALPLLVEAVEQHRNGSAQMRHDELDVRIAVGDLLGDHVQDESRVLERGADRRAPFVIDDERRADPAPRRMHEEDGAAPVHLGIERLELGLGDRPVETGDVHVDADAAELVEPALHLLQRRVDVRQGQHDVRRDPLRIAVRKVGIAVVEHLDGFDALGLVRQVGRVVRRQHLLLDPGLIHPLETVLDVLRRIRERVQRHPALRRQMSGRGKPVAHQPAEILRRIVRVDIADHQALPSSRLSAVGYR